MVRNITLHHDVTQGAGDCNNKELANNCDEFLDKSDGCDKPNVPKNEEKAPYCRTTEGDIAMDSNNNVLGCLYQKLLSKYFYLTLLLLSLLLHGGTSIELGLSHFFAPLFSLSALLQ